MYRPFTDLNLGFSNAENYQRRENKELLVRYFVRDEYLDRLVDPNVYYLVGEKGTGKTAYATFLRNSDYKNHKADIFNVRQTEYQKFIELKRQGHLPLSQYADVWRTLLLFAVATTVVSQSGTPEFLQRFTKLAAVKRAIDEFYEDAFAPELVKMISFVESSERASSLLAKYMGLSTKASERVSETHEEGRSVFQVNLLKLRQAFEGALKPLKLEQRVVVFIDGIDVRPADIPYADYFDCIRGLIEAVWAINNDFLADMKASQARIRVVLLVRPDTFLRTGLHNLNTKLRDNAVLLNWMTTYKDYRGSLLFRVADRLLSAQQDSAGAKLGEAWDHYFPFFAENVTEWTVSDKVGVNSFLAFLRFSYYRPRDLTTMIATLQDLIAKKKGVAAYVTADDFNDPSFRDAHAEYLLGEIRDQLLFYYSQDEYDLFLQFFSQLRGKRRFTYDQFLNAFNEFIIECTASGKVLPQFFESSDVFLQFLYEQNVICYKERDASGNEEAELFIRWCFRERTLSNIAPKIRTGVDYEIFYGLSKALNVGRQVRVRDTNARRHVGTVTVVEVEKGFGFVRGGERQMDYYFKIEEYSDNRGGFPARKSKDIFRDPGKIRKAEGARSETI